MFLGHSSFVLDGLTVDPKTGVDVALAKITTRLALNEHRDLLWNPLRLLKADVLTKPEVSMELGGCGSTTRSKQAMRSAICW